MSESNTQARPSFRTGNRHQKGRRSLPMATERRVAVHNDPYKFTFKDPEVGELKILNSDQGAWWAQDDAPTRIQKLVEAWKIDCNDKEACIYAGITPRQLEYFQELHPDVWAMKDLCRERLGFLAKKKFAKDVENNGDKALEYLKMKRKSEGYTTRIDITSGDKPLPSPNTVVFMRFDRDTGKAEPIKTEATVVEPAQVEAPKQEAPAPAQAQEEHATGGTAR